MAQWSKHACIHACLPCFPANTPQGRWDWLKKETEIYPDHSHSRFGLDVKYVLKMRPKAPTTCATTENRRKNKLPCALHNPPSPWPSLLLLLSSDRTDS